MKYGDVLIPDATVHAALLHGCTHVAGLDAYTDGLPELKFGYIGSRTRPKRGAIPPKPDQPTFEHVMGMRRLSREPYLLGQRRYNFVSTLVYKPMELVP